MSRWKTGAAICFCTLLLAACGNESAAKKVVLAELKDPDSAKFGDFSKHGDVACLTVNARNAMGGYVGNREAVLQKADGIWQVLDIIEISHDNCVKQMIKDEEAAKTRSKSCDDLKKKLSAPALQNEKDLLQQIQNIYNMSCK